MQRMLYFYIIMLVTITGGNRNVHLSQESLATEFSNGLVVKSNLKQVDHTCSFNLLIGKFWYLYLNIDIFASLIKKNFSIAFHYRLSLIG